jgi:transposase
LAHGIIRRYIRSHRRCGAQAGRLGFPRGQNQALAAILEDGEVALGPRVCALIKDMREEWCDLDRRICAFDNEFAARAREDEGARRLATIPGIGVLNATALVAAIGDGRVLRGGAICRPGLVSSHGNRRPAASRA